MTSFVTTEQRRSELYLDCRFIEETGQRLLGLPRVTVATAIALFHNFNAKSAVRKHDRLDVSMACLLLAGKIEESPMELDLIINKCLELRISSPDPESDCARLRERVVRLELDILDAIDFEVNIDHPYKYAVDCIRAMAEKQLIEYSKPPKTIGDGDEKIVQNTRMVKDLVKQAVRFAHDSMYSSLCVSHSAQEVAMSCVYLACKCLDIRPIGGKTWTELLEIPTEVLAAVSFTYQNWSISKK